MARKHGKRSGNVKSARECARGRIVTAAWNSGDDDGLTATDAPGSAIVTVRGSAARRLLRRYCDDNGLCPPMGIGEPIAVGRGGPVYDDFRVVAPAVETVPALAFIMAAECRPDWVTDAHFDCPIRVTQRAAGGGPEKIRAGIPSAFKPIRRVKRRGAETLPPAAPSAREPFRPIPSAGMPVYGGYIESNGRGGIGCVRHSDLGAGI